ncbi:outer membrane beta-barrel protein [Tenacibaculum sp. nBUS_03]|uniref:outer membrane beta-barrel protein n=1 Tax=Tenacibaculum sp. nBUS_03 TaxID=3395320 RepID=UPI003EBF9768
MKHKITIVLLFLLSYTLYSQQIKGLILDKDRQSIPYAEVLLYNNTGAKLIKGTITNENGEFLIDNLKLEESYTIKISFLGYKQKKIVNILVKKDINLGEIIILEDRTTLDEVEITARKPLIKIESDKLVFNVGVSISNEGLNGLELLRKTPGVIINMNNQILLRGKIGTLVYIDDNTTYLSGYQLTRFLESLNTNDIESLEVISNPSSKYDAEGNAGIINIRLKKNKYYGTNGSFNTGFRYGKKPKHNVGINLNKRTEKLNIFGGLTAKYQLNVSNLEVQRKFNNYDSTDRLSETNTENHPLNLSLGADYVLNSKSFLGIKTRLNTNYLTDKSNINSRTAIVNFQNTPINSVLLAETEDLDNLLNANLNLHYAFKDTIGNNWTIDLNKGYYSFSQQRDQPNLYYNNDLTNLLDDNSIESNSHSIINFHTLQSDYSKKINNFFLSSFQAGVKYSKVHTNNELNFYNVIVNNSIENLEKSNDFSYNEEIIAGYTSIKGFSQ